MPDPHATPAETVLLDVGHEPYVACVEPGARMLRVGGGDSVPPTLRGLTFERDARPEPYIGLPVFRRVARQV